MTSPGPPASPRPIVHTSVVVGFDGSRGAEQAVRWAADEASLRHAELEVVSCWSTPPAVTPAAVVMSAEVSNLLESGARRTVDNGARIARLRGHQIAVRRVVVEGPAGPSLVERSTGGTLLVVGRRGRSPAAELLLGSTSAYCVHHSRCPVAVVPTAVRHEQRRAPALEAAHRN
jgi:nucleotide-binding universal stress UspA family protein